MSNTINIKAVVMQTIYMNLNYINIIWLYCKTKLGSLTFERDENRMIFIEYFELDYGKHGRIRSIDKHQIKTTKIIQVTIFARIAEECCNSKI